MPTIVNKPEWSLDMTCPGCGLTNRVAEPDVRADSCGWLGRLIQKQTTLYALCAHCTDTLILPYVDVPLWVRKSAVLREIHGGASDGSF